MSHVHVVVDLEVELLLRITCPLDVHVGMEQLTGEIQLFVYCCSEDRVEVAENIFNEVFL